MFDLVLMFLLLGDNKDYEVVVSSVDVWYNLVFDKQFNGRNT